MMATFSEAPGSAVGLVKISIGSVVAETCCPSRVFNMIVRCVLCRSPSLTAGSLMVTGNFFVA